MSKDARKIKTVNRHVRHDHPKPVVTLSPEKRQKIMRIAIFVLIGILAGIPFIMGKYCEFNQPDAFDSGCYVYSAQKILNGAIIGVDEMPSAKVGTLLINILGVRMFGFNEIGPKLIQTFFQVSALCFMFYVMLQLYGMLPAAIGVIIASIYLSAPIISKAGNVKEQYMIASMILGISFFILGQIRGKWIYTLLAGAFVSLGPLFKETGLSAIGGLGLFVLIQPLLKHVTWKKTGKDILLLFAGALIFNIPISLWLASHKTPPGYYPYAALWMPLVQHFSSPADDAIQQPENTEDANDNIAAGTNNDKSSDPGFFLRMMPPYVRDSWMVMDTAQRNAAFARVFRWYRVLILPILLALGSIFIRVLRIFINLRKKPEERTTSVSDRFVFLFTIWWLLDMGFIFISPRSYEQYYLPLNASAAMLGGYIIMLYREKLKNIIYRPHWIGAGFVGFILMIAMVWHIFFGVSKSAFSGNPYPDGKSNGYVQRLKEASAHANGTSRGAWENIGEYIRDNSTPDDNIYVWGWFPGIYVAAQRLSLAPKAFESNMHTHPPIVLAERINEILNSFRKKPPKFIVDSRKQHFPWDRPPLELWPVINKGLLPIEPISGVNAYDKEWEDILRKGFGEDEALRYRAMNPFRIYIRNYYTPIVRREFGSHILFQRKEN